MYLRNFQFFAAHLAGVCGVNNSTAYRWLKSGSDNIHLHINPFQLKLLTILTNIAVKPKAAAHCRQLGLSITEGLTIRGTLFAVYKIFDLEFRPVVKLDTSASLTDTRIPPPQEPPA